MKNLGYKLVASAALVFAISPAVKAEDVGTISWDPEVAQVASWDVTAAQCGFSADDFIMIALSEGVRLRLAFRGEGTPESVAFGAPSSADLSFRDGHPASGQQFRMSASMGDMGEVDADPDRATGRLHLRAASVSALDAHPEGLTVAYEFHCTEAYF